MIDLCEELDKYMHMYLLKTLLGQYISWLIQKLSYSIHVPHAGFHLGAALWLLYSGNK